MAKKEAVRSALPARGLGRLLGAAKAVKRLFTRKEDTPQVASAGTSGKSKQRSAKKQAATQPERIVRREADIPLDVLDRAYMPADTSSKASFRSDGRDHHDDQEMALGVVDERWNDEDRLTNKSGDPRIGTRRRTYEPEEARAESRE